MMNVDNGRGGDEEKMKLLRCGAKQYLELNMFEFDNDDVGLALA